MMKFYCTLPNCKESFDTERGLYYHENRRSSIHKNRNKCYEPLWDRNTYIAYKMVTPAPKSLHGLQDKNEKLSQCFKKKIRKATCKL